MGRGRASSGLDQPSALWGRWYGHRGGRLRTGQGRAGQGCAGRSCGSTRVVCWPSPSALAFSVRYRWRCRTPTNAALEIAATPFAGHRRAKDIFRYPSAAANGWAQSIRGTATQHPQSIS